MRRGREKDKKEEEKQRMGRHFVCRRCQGPKVQGIFKVFWVFFLENKLEGTFLQGNPPLIGIPGGERDITSLTSLTNMKYFILFLLHRPCFTSITCFESFFSYTPDLKESAKGYPLQIGGSLAV